jgi:glycogen synthase
MEYPPYPSYISAGGVGTHTYYLSKSLAARGHEIHVIACGDCECDELVEGIYIHRIRSLPSSLLRLLVYSMRASQKLRSLNETLKFDIVHNQSPYGFFEAYLHKIDKRIKLVTTIHAVPFREMANYERVHQLSLKNLDETLRLLVPQILFNKAEYTESHKIITVSNNNRLDLIKLLNIPNERITVIYNGVDADKFNPNIDGQEIRKKFGLEGSKIILYVGRLERHKGLYMLLDAARRIIGENKDVHLLIVGSGKHKIDLMQIGRNIGEEIVFAGRVPDELLSSYYSAADVVALPSLYEGGPPLTLLEAMASAKPIITTNVPPINELVDNHTAVLINPVDTELFAKKITNLLLDEKSRRVLGRNARSKVLECFTWEKVAQKTENVYKEAINEK